MSDVIAVANIERTPTGARITGIPTLAQWMAAFDLALDVDIANAWVRGDLLRFAEDETPYGEDFTQALKPSKKSPGTLANDKRRSKRFPIDHPCRRFPVSPSHFDAVAALDSDDDAEIVLTQAWKEDLGREWAREEVRRIKNTPRPPKPVKFEATLAASVGCVQFPVDLTEELAALNGKRVRVTVTLLEAA